MFLYIVLCALCYEANCEFIQTLRDSDVLSPNVLRVRHAHEDEPSSSDNIRELRSITESNASTSTIPNVEVIDLHDGHYQIQLDWSGKGDSDTMVILGSQPGMNSTLHVSHDYGLTFKTVTLNVSDNQTARIDGFIKGPVTYQLYVMVDLTHRALFVSTDDCNTFQKHVVQFVPSYISFHPTLEMMMALDSNSGILYTSANLGATWIPSTTIFPGQRIKDAIWNPTSSLIYLIVRQLNDTRLSDVYETDINLSTAQLLISGTLEFLISDDYMFAVKDHPSNSESLVLMVSYKQGSFRIARFPHSSEGQILTEKSYYIADTSEQQVFVAVYHRQNLSNLYISEEEGISYSLSLDNVLFDDAAISHNNYYNLRALQSYKVIDFHKVQGLKGAYIASQINTANELESFITFDKGGVWQHLVAPSRSADGKLHICEWPDCSLHLASQFSLSKYYVEPIYTRDTTPGIVMASGYLGASMTQSYSNNYNLYVSNTSGATWREAIAGKHYYQFADFGSILTAIRQFTATNYFEYSLDEGARWHRYYFYNSTNFVAYGMLTEPGEATTVIGIYGGDFSVSPHNWIMIRIDFSEVLAHECAKSDYYQWSPSENLIDHECILGERETFERKIASHLCLNGGEYEREVNRSICPCTREDYECDFGFEEDDGNVECIPSDQYDVQWGIPYPCPTGDSYTISVGYRRIIGDKCVGGEENDFIPRNYTCPVVKDSVQLQNSRNNSRGEPIIIGVGESIQFTASTIYKNGIMFLWYSSSTNRTISTTDSSKTYTFNKAGMFFVTVSIVSNVSSIVDFNSIKVYDHLTSENYVLQANNVNPLIGEQVTITAFLPARNEFIYGDVTFDWSVDDGSARVDSHLQVLTISFTTTGRHLVSALARNSLSTISASTAVEVIDVRSEQFKVQVLGTSSVRISWTQAPALEYVTSYQIYYRVTNSEGPFHLMVDLFPSIRSYLTTTLEADTQYQFQLMATVNNRAQAASDIVNITTEPLVLNSPQNVRIVNSTIGSYTIAWDPVNSPYVFYQVLVYSMNQYFDDVMAKLVEVGTSTNYTQLRISFIPNDLFVFQVVAVIEWSSGRRVTSIPSKDVSTRDDHVTYTPYPPRNPMSHLINSTCVQLLWTPPLDVNRNVTQIVDGYNFTVIESAGNTVAYKGSTVEPFYLLCDLIQSSRYSYNVRSVVGLQQSDDVLSDTFEMFPYDPLAPSTVVVEPLTDTSVRLSWKPPVTNDRNYISGYIIQDDFHSIHVTVASYQYSMTLYGLKAYELYNFTVSVKRSNEKSYAAHWTTGITKQGIPDAPLCNKSATDSKNTTAILSWAAPPHINGVMKQYEVVLHDPMGEIIPHYFTADTTLFIRSLRPSTTYTYSVRAHNMEGVGPYCNYPVTFYTDRALKSVVEVEITFQYSLVFDYSIHDQTKLFIDSLISTISQNLTVNKNIFAGPHLQYNETTVVVDLIILSTKDTSADTVASQLIQNGAGVDSFRLKSSSIRIVTTAPAQSVQPDDPNKSTAQEWVLVTSIFVSVAFNVLFLFIIGFGYQKNRSLYRSNHQLLSRDRLRYNRVNSEVDIDDAITSDYINSSSPSPDTDTSSNNNNNDDDPMIDL